MGNLPDLILYVSTKKWIGIRQAEPRNGIPSQRLGTRQFWVLFKFLWSGPESLPR